jgi:cysteinyl-tRNA synthetase
MSVKYLGPKFDIHTGGIDHIPVHHNNEIAQSVCAGYPYAKVWMHNAFLNINDGRMAKSEGNFITLQTLKEKGIDPLAYRYLLLTAQYSSPMNFNLEALEGAQNAWNRIRSILDTKVTIDGMDFEQETNGELKNEYIKEFTNYINNNLDTPKAISLLHQILNDERLWDNERKNLILNFDKILGLKLGEGVLRAHFDIPEEVQKLIEERDRARAEKDFTKSDELRAQIESLGFEVMDTPEGTKVEKR